MRMNTGKYILIIVAAIYSTGLIFGQAPEVSWFKSYGGAYLDEGQSIVMSTDNQLMIAGYTYASVNGGSDIYLIKTNLYGELIWQTYIGGISDDWASSIQQTSDGGFIVAGGTESFEVAGSDIYLVKINTDGQVLWQRTYGGDNSEQADYVLQTDDGGYILVGWTNSFGAGEDDIYMLRTNSVGDSLWARTFGDIFYDKGYSALQTSDGGFVVIGGLGYFGYYPTQAYMIKVDENGDSLWACDIGGSLSDAGRSIAHTADGGFLFTGWTMSYGAGEHDVYLAKVDSEGEFLWSNAFGGEETDVGRSIYPTSDGGFIIAGYTRSFDVGLQDVYLVKADYKGDTLWTTTFGGDSDDYGWSAIESADGGYLVTGWTRTFSQGSKDVLLVKFEPDHAVHIDNFDNLLSHSSVLHQNYPNPFNDHTTISYSIQERQHINLSIYDLLGREIRILVDETVEPGSYSTAFNSSGLASGVYLCLLRAGNYSETKRMVLTK
ncbi:MAG: T9SS type A sorting domain-containing protein [candidate division Zixibacteria bacterium]|nr:T9SS type A sorting domain-containing protein [candidate division Zixibacteria bacterium]